MDNPFRYGKAVSGEYFTNRVDEIKLLKNTLRSGQNVIITSPRRHGKTSLIKHVLADLKKEGILTVYVDLYSATSKEKLVDIYARAIANDLTPKAKKGLKAITEFLPKLLPQILINNDGKAEFRFSFNFQKKNRVPILKDLYEAVHKIAKKGSRKAVVVFDEFQEILNFEDDEIEREMRSHFQFHQNVAYTFLGSKTHIMNKIFNDRNRPFFKSGMFFKLKRMPQEVMAKWITKRFIRNNIKLDEGAKHRIIDLTECHPYSMQQLCHFVWNLYHDRRKISVNEVDNSLDEVLISQNENYLNIYDSLTVRQKEFIMALAKKSGMTVFSKDFLVLNKHLTSSGIQRVVKSLMEKYIIEKDNGNYIFCDIFFSLWLQKKITA